MSSASSKIFKDNDVVSGQCNSYRIVKEISSGGYGAVYRVLCQAGRVERSYALKVERKLPERDHFKLIMERRVMRAAREQEAKKRKHFPEFIDFCMQRDRMWIVMTLLGESLADIKRQLPNRIFNLKTGYYCAVECLEAIRDLHALGFVHRDIKPANFVIGRRNSQDFNRIYIVDFGIARNFLDENGSMKTPRAKVRFKGTVRFAPLATHRLQELGRKDDIESWLYMIVDMVNINRLPWHEIEDRKEVERMKCRAHKTPSLIFTDKHLQELMMYATQRHYVDNFDYDWARQMVKKAAGIEDIFTPPYDWNKSL